MLYRVELFRDARQALSSLSDKTRGQVSRKIESLASEPRPRGSKALQGKRKLTEVGDSSVIGDRERPATRSTPSGS